MAESKKYKKRSAGEILDMKAVYDAGASLSEVGANYGITSSRVEQIFRRNKLKTRSKTVSKKFLAAMDDRRIILDKEVLTKLYTEEKLSMAKVAEKLGVGFHTVRRNLQDYDILIRPIENFTRSRLTAELLKTLYIDKNLTAAEIAARLGYSPLTIGKKLSNFGIKKRVSARHKLLSGFAAPNPPERSDDPAVNSENVETGLPIPTLTVKEIVESYGLHIATVRKLIRDGTFPNACREIKGKIRRWRVPAGDLENFTPRSKGREKISTPAAGTIRSRSQRAKKQIKDSHGYGKKEIREMIELEDQGLLREEIAVRYRLDEEIVAELLDQAARLKPRPKKLPPVKKELKRLPEKKLTELYVEGKFSTAYILEELDTNYAALYINLRHYGIPLRDERLRSTAQENEQLLYRLAVEENLSPQLIADRLKLTEPYIRRKINEIRCRLKTTEINDSEF